MGWASCRVWAVDPVVPSPKVHCKLVTEPSGSLLWSVKLQPSPVQLNVNAAVGGWFGAFTCTVCDTGLELAFWLSLTVRSEEHTSELQSRQYVVCRLHLVKQSPKVHCQLVTEP